MAGVSGQSDNKVFEDMIADVAKELQHVGLGLEGHVASRGDCLQCRHKDKLSGVQLCQKHHDGCAKHTQENPDWCNVAQDRQLWRTAEQAM